MAAATILDFLKFYIFNDRKDEERRTASLCQIWREISLKPRWRYVSFRFFKMAAATILHFRNFKIFNGRTVKRIELHQHAKFRQNRLNRGRDMAFLDF